MRRAEDLLDRLNEERVWRIKEISTLRNLAARPSLSPVEREIYCRAGVALMYAHWEGFVKRAAVHYLKFVSFQRLRLDEMSDPILALYVRQCAVKSGLGEDARLANRFMREQGYQPKLGWKNVVSTQSNLSSTVLAGICQKLGLDESHFETKSVYIDKILLKERNAIAHGEKGEVDVAKLSEMATEVIGLITTFRDLADNAASTKGFRRNPAVTAESR